MQQFSKIPEGQWSGLMENVEQRCCAMWLWAERTLLKLYGVHTEEVAVLFPQYPGRDSESIKEQPQWTMSALSKSHCSGSGSAFPRPGFTRNQGINPQGRFLSASPGSLEIKRGDLSTRKKPDSQ